MRKSLSTIQSLAKLGKVLSNIVFVASIVFTVICGLTALLIYLGLQETVNFNGVDIHGLVENASGYSTTELFSIAISGFFSSLFEAILSKTAAKYFKTQISAATPFTTTCAKGMKRLGILTIILPLVGIILGIAASGLLIDFNPDNIPSYTDFSGSLSISLGIMFIILGVVFKYGTEILWEKTSCVNSSENVPQFDIISRGTPSSDAYTESTSDVNSENDLVRGFKSIAVSDMEQEIAAKVERGFGPSAPSIIEDNQTLTDIPQAKQEVAQSSTPVNDSFNEFAESDDSADEDAYGFCDASTQNNAETPIVIEEPDTIKEKPCEDTKNDIDDFSTRFKNEFGTKIDTDIDI